MDDVVQELALRNSLVHMAFSRFAQEVLAN